MKPLIFGMFCVIILLLVAYSKSPQPVHEQNQGAWAHFSPKQLRLIDAFSEGEPRMVCFAPGADPDFTLAMDQATQVARTKQFLYERHSSNYRYSGSRWSQTATDGVNTGSNGEGVTLTWTVVPDGTPIGSSGDDGDGENSTLRAKLDTIYGSEANWLPLFTEVFDGWAAVTGNTYVYVTYDDGGTLGQGGEKGVLGSYADIRIAGHSIDGNPGSNNVLAYNYFPSNGDMVIDTDDMDEPTDYFYNLANNSRRLRNMLYHEHGHGLGLDHVCPANFTKIMEPTLNLSFDGLQHDDIRGGQAAYGDRFDDNNSAGSAETISVSHAATTSTTELSIDTPGEVDWFKITAPQDGVMRVIAKPSGLYYNSGPQDSACTGSLINSKAMQNLGITVYESDGTTVIRSGNNWPVGENESSQLVNVTAATDYLIAVSSNSSSSEVQLYDLDISLADPVFAMGAPTDETNISFADVNITGAEVKGFNGVIQDYEDVTDIDTERGYWVSITPFNPDFSTRTKLVGQVTYNLSLGWNLLSVPSDVCIEWDSSLISVESAAVTVSLSKAAQSNNWVEDYAWIYEQSSHSYQPVYDSGVLSVGGDEIPGGSSFWFYSKINNAILKIDVPVTGVCSVLP